MIARNKVANLAFALMVTVGCTAQTIATEPRCRDVEGLDSLLAPGGALLLGEMHGTVQSPNFAGNAACLALRAGSPVVVALEIPVEEQARADAFVNSDGSASEQAKLLGGPFWTAAFQDGRRSKAMLALLDQVRDMRRRGQRVQLKFVDREAQPPTPEERDRGMAEALAAAADAAPGSVIILLAGNVHTRIERGVPWDSAYAPAGFVLRTLRPALRVVALDVSYASGTAWICTDPSPSSCGVREVRGKGDDGERVTLHPNVAGGHNGAYSVGALSASPPAVQR